MSNFGSYSIWFSWVLIVSILILKGKCFIFEQVRKENDPHLCIKMYIFVWKSPSFKDGFSPFSLFNSFTASLCLVYLEKLYIYLCGTLV